MLIGRVLLVNRLTHRPITARKMHIGFTMKLNSREQTLLMDVVKMIKMAVWVPFILNCLNSAGGTVRNGT